ncbi:MAG TPA: glycosyltransferase family 39 protein [Chloroflexota bacterium]|nr:glycosyltransferase family 39 protein [Chloroflexota bacterium]
MVVDGQAHALSSVLGPGWRAVVLEQPGPLDREYQVDGSDTTATDDRQPAVIKDLLGSPLYAVDAWLRDEGSYSRWGSLAITDLTSGEQLHPDAPLPNDFRVTAALRRPEAAARLWLLGPTGDRREGLELDRDRRNARWIIERNGGRDVLPRWFFPEQPAPFAAELLHLFGRSAAAGYGLAMAVLAVATVLSRLAPRAAFHSGASVQRLVRLAPDAILSAWLLAAALVSTRLYHQLPHILDAVSYTFQAGQFDTGRLALPEPPLVNAFKGPFTVLRDARLFSQYPPGASTVYALGQALSLEWLVGPLTCLALIAATAWTARALFGRSTGLVVLALAALSPFILFQAGSFLSHPVAGALLASTLAAFVRGEQQRSVRWYAVSGVLLGAGFVTREIGAVLFALPLGARLLQTRRVKPALTLALCGLPFVLLYLAYNAAQTGSPTVLPRALFDPSDRFGFGDGIGFHTRHTLAAGLANTDELLTLLQFDLFGWPPLFALALLGVPFLFGRARAWDWLAAGGVLAFVVAYIGYFYHGVALGPRYYFETLPWLLLLAGRGAQVLAQLAASRLAVAVVLGLLSLNTVLLYDPLTVQRRADLSGMPGGRKVNLAFVQTGLLGPHLDGVPDGSLVLTADWWLYNTALAALNCPRLPDCAVLFGLATNAEDEQRLIAQYPGRTVLRTRTNGDLVDLVGVSP